MIQMMRRLTLTNDTSLKNNYIVILYNEFRRARAIFNGRGSSRNI